MFLKDYSADVSTTLQEGSRGTKRSWNYNVEKCFSLPMMKNLLVIVLETF